MALDKSRAMRLGVSVVLTVLTVFLLTAAAICFDGLNDKLGRADVGVVLGTKVEPNGYPSPAMAARLDEAVTLYRRHYFNRIIVSGGTGWEGYDEAKVMKAYLRRMNIPEGVIITDSHGDNTKATARNSAAWMRTHGVTSALLVSQYYHLTRTRLAFRRCGINRLYTAHARLFLWRDIYAIPRDVVGYYSYLLFDWGC